MSWYLGLAMMQNRYAVSAFRTLFRHLHERRVEVARIIELGTGLGGLSVFLKTYCVGADAEFITYDRAESVRENPVLRELGVAIRPDDLDAVATIVEIARETQKLGVTLLLCDGPNNVAAVQRFAPYLKPGDIVMAHDYAPSRELFNTHINGRLWSWCEVTDDDVADISRRYWLEPLLQEDFVPAVWMCRIKRSPEMTPAPASTG